MNPHHKEATVLLTDKPGEYEPGQYEIEKSKALATLALAYEQRTANLIAMYTDGNTGTAPGVNYKDLLEAIAVRLDLA